MVSHNSQCLPSQVRPKSVACLTWLEHSYVAVSTPVTPSLTTFHFLMTSIAKDVASVASWTTCEKCVGSIAKISEICRFYINNYIKL